MWGQLWKRINRQFYDFLKKVAFWILPHWLQVQKSKKRLSDWDLTSDGCCTYAVTAHGDYICDTNEEIAIPPCKKGLDYCCSNEETSAQFIGYAQGSWIFQYTGQKEKTWGRCPSPICKTRGVSVQLITIDDVPYEYSSIYVFIKILHVKYSVIIWCKIHT